MPHFTDVQLAELRKVAEAATPYDEHVVEMRYAHGGARVYREAPGQGRDLHADLYGEGPDAECWIAARAALLNLLADLTEAREALRRVTKITAGGPHVSAKDGMLAALEGLDRAREIARAALEEKPDEDDDLELGGWVGDYD